MTTPMNPTPSTTPSPVIRHPSSGLITSTDFEWKTHEQLRAMIEQADPLSTQDLGAKLQVAAATIKKIGEDLKGHMANVEWAGQGGEAFREWGTDMANAALRLGEFSHSTGSWMIDAAATLSAVKSAMPEVSTESKTLLDSFRANHPGQVGAIAAPGLSGQTGGLSGPAASGPSQAQAYAAQQQLDADRAEAARLMRKLAESYSWSAHQISAGERPTFRPMPGNRDNYDGAEYIPMPDGSRQGYGSQARESGMTGISAATTVGGQVSRADQHDTVSPRMSRQGGASTAPVAEHRGAVLPERKIGTAIDSVTSLPSTPSTPPNGPVGGQANGHAQSGSLPLPGLAMPYMTGTAAGGASGNGVGRVSPSTRPAMPVGPGMGATRSGLAVPRVSEPGIVGGRTVSPGLERPTGQLPRGTAIGTEPGQAQSQARPPMGAGTVGGLTGPGGNRTGVGAGRRLATEPGGVVGGLPVRRPGAAGEFTPGGAGLVRTRPTVDGSPSTRTGPQGPAFSAPTGTGGTTSRRGHGRRPDYLVEDEETWSQGNRRVVPPVID